MYFTPARTLPVFASTTWTTIGSGVPLKSLFGVNFTFPVDVLSSPLGVTSVTVGVYFAVAGVPLASFA